MGVKVTTRATEAQTSPTECITLHRDYSNTPKSDQFAGDEFQGRAHPCSQRERKVRPDVYKTSHLKVSCLAVAAKKCTKKRDGRVVVILIKTLLF